MSAVSGSSRKRPRLPQAMPPQARGKRQRDKELTLQQLITKLASDSLKYVYPVVAWATSHSNIWENFGTATHLNHTGYEISRIKASVPGRNAEPPGWMHSLALVYYLVNAQSCLDVLKYQARWAGREGLERVRMALASNSRLVNRRIYLIRTLDPSSLAVHQAACISKVSQWMTIVDVPKQGRFWVQWAKPAPKVRKLSAQDLANRLNILAMSTFEFQEVSYGPFPSASQADTWMAEKIPAEVVLSPGQGTALVLRSDHSFTFPREPSWRSIGSLVHPETLKKLQIVHAYARSPVANPATHPMTRWTSCGFTACGLFSELGANETDYQCLEKGSIINALEIGEKALRKFLPSRSLVDWMLVHWIDLDGNLELSTGELLCIDHTFIVLQYLQRKKKGSDELEVRYLVAQSYIQAYRLVDWLQHRRTEGRSSDGSYSRQEFEEEFQFPLSQLLDESLPPIDYVKLYLDLFCSPANITISDGTTAEWLDELEASVRFAQLSSVGVV